MKVRPPAVAGTFYPSSPAQIRKMVSSYIAEARPRLPKNGHRVRAVIAPHAGYAYSGPIAGSSYAALASLKDSVRTVFLFGPSHFVAFEGLALPDAEAFETPLGLVRIDPDAYRVASALPQVIVSAEAHASEHSLEVQLPFLQEVLPEVCVLPFAVGDASANDVVDVMERLLEMQHSAMIISSDLSHYLSYEAAQRADRDTSDRILRLEGPIQPDRACGAAPLNGLLRFAEDENLEPRLLDLRNSGDTAGDRSRVVGYGAFSFSNRL